MDDKWNELIELVETRNLDSASWRSNQDALKLILTYAKEHKLKPDEKLGRNFSNLREIIADAREAIEQQDDKRLEELFHLAARKTTGDLRLILEKRDLVNIHIKKRVDGEETRFIFEVTEDQLNRIEKSTDQFFKFIREGAE